MTPEGQLKKAVMGYLELRKGVFFSWRNNTGAYKTGDRFVRFGHVGSSDVLGIVSPRGRLVAIELKAPKGKLSEEQWAFLRDVNARGGYGCVARSVQDVADAIQAAAVGCEAPSLEEPRKTREKRLGALPSRTDGAR